MGKGQFSGASGDQSWTARMYDKTSPVCLVSVSDPQCRRNRISGYAFNHDGGKGAGSYFQEPVTAGKWIHYVLIINTRVTSAAYPFGYTKIFKNGVPKPQDSLECLGICSAPIVPTNTTAPFRVATQDRHSFLQGAIGKVAIYDYEVSEARLKVHYGVMNKPLSFSEIPPNPVVKF